MAGNAIAYAAIGIAAAAIAVALAASASIMQVQEQISGLVPAAAEPQTREFYLFSEVDESINEDELGIPPDKFSLEEITVNRGDRVVIHFYNLEPEETEEKHSFTMADHYQTHNDVDASDNKTIEFVADQSGVFQYQCIYHQPTMSGNLVVLSP
ncbi:cupredoxin domain-containing protein [Nitrososphaera sp.]|uniref:cupredoxin domain-containing protein n=1 Tax=Nitrososphaera sp. TaxID=1971748 RepID=UPI003181E328